jgi:hypothetical protein
MANRAFGSSGFVFNRSGPSPAQFAEMKIAKRTFRKWRVRPLGCDSTTYGAKASDQTIMAIAGHMPQKMLAHYSHVRLEAKRTALDALGGEGKTDGYERRSGASAERNYGATHNETPELEQGERYLFFQN